MATSETSGPSSLHQDAQPRQTGRGLLMILCIAGAVEAALPVFPGNPAAELGYGSLLVLAPLAFISGMLSFLSPCCAARRRRRSAVAEEDELEESPLSAALGRISRFVALLAAWLAMGGSLFFSEVLGWIPCTLCWYQRILMYPLSILLAVGILRRDDGLHRYVLPFSLTGAGVSLYHYLLIKTDWFPPPPCRAGVPCTVDYLDIFGFINIPFMALTAFLITSLMMLVSRLAPYDEPEMGAPAGPRALVSPAALPVYGIVVAVIAAFVITAFVITARLL